MPDVKFGTKAEIPAEFASEATERDGAFYVDLHLNSKVSEFRNKNISLSQERDKLLPRVGRYEKIVGEDPDAFETELIELRSTAQLVKDGKLQTSDKIAAEVTKRTKEATDAATQRAQAATQDATLAKEAAKGWQAKHDQLALNQQVHIAVSAKDSPVNPEALPDVLSRAARLFQVQEDGSVLAMQGGVKVPSKKGDGTQPLSIAEWLEDVVKQAPYLGKGSAGGGANGGRETDKTAGMNSAEFNALDPADRIARYRAANKSAR